MADDGLFGLTSGSPSHTKTQLTATLGQLTLCDGSPVRVSVQTDLVVCACEWDVCVSVYVCVCVCVSLESLYGWMVYQMAR